MSLPPAPFAAASFVQSVDKLQHALSASVLTSPDFSVKTVINMDANNKRKSSSGDSKYLPELLAEKDSLDSSFTHAMKLLGAGQCVSIHH